MSAGSPNDTHPKVEAFLVEGYRRMSPSQKLARVCALTRAVQELALVDVRRRHPDADAHEQSLRVASRWLDPDLVADMKLSHVETVRKGELASGLASVAAGGCTTGRRGSRP